jgi:hypothetical protein
MWHYPSQRGFDTPLTIDLQCVWLLGGKNSLEFSANLNAAGDSTRMWQRSCYIILTHTPLADSSSRSTLRWITDNRAADPYLTDNRIHIIRYEHLIADPHGTADHIFRFLENKPAPSEVHRQFDQQANLTWGRLDPVLNEPKERPTGGPAAAVINKHLRNWQVCTAYFVEFSMCTWHSCIAIRDVHNLHSVPVMRLSR